jgi:hypothetical protein
VTLLFPPATDPRSPHLAIPSLAAALRAAGVHTTVRDLDLEGMLWLLDGERLRDAAAACERRFDGAGAVERERLRPCLAAADDVVGEVPGALATLRDPVGFFDPDRHHAARACLVAALELVSAASGRVRYNISGAAYDVEGCDPSRLGDLIAVTGDPDANLFDELYRTSVVPQLERERPDVVGISILNRQQILPGLTLARMLKAEGYFVVVGGTVYAKFVPELLRRPAFFETFCDGVVPYEGETALLSLVEQLGGRRDLDAVPNLMHLGRDGRPVLNQTHLEDVSALPTPDFDGHPLDQYLAPAPVLPILTGKGCYFNRCKFCDIPYINRIADKPYRVRAPERVAADVAALNARHGARHFEITDETLSPRLLTLLGKALEAYPGLDARFVGYARFEPAFTPETCRRIHAMGVRKLFFGLESGSQATLDHMDKGYRLPVVRRVLRNCADAGLAVHVFSIIGFPEETEERARETLDFFLDSADVLDHPRHTFDIHPFGLDLRTEYGEEAGRFGLLLDVAHLSGRDFPISVERWTNQRGLGEDDVRRLLDEFGATLRARYRGWRNYPDQQWPGFEEYAVLYGDHYEARPFGYRLALPPAGNGDRVRLIWAEGVRFEELPGPARPHRVSTSMGSTVVGMKLLGILAGPRPPMTVDELLATLAAEVPHDRQDRSVLLDELRAGIDRLLAARVLWLKPAFDGPGSESPARARTPWPASV